MHQRSVNVTVQARAFGYFDSTNSLSVTWSPRLVRFDLLLAGHALKIAGDAVDTRAADYEARRTWRNAASVGARSERESFSSFHWCLRVLMAALPLMGVCGGGNSNPLIGMHPNPPAISATNHSTIRVQRQFGKIRVEPIAINCTV